MLLPTLRLPEVETKRVDEYYDVLEVIYPGTSTVPMTIGHDRA
jgi:hypothetical protein